MSVWLERFVLTLLAGFLGAIVLTNPWRLDRIQQATLVVAVVALSLFAARTIERMRLGTTPEPPSAQSATSPVGHGRSDGDEAEGNATSVLRDGRRDAPLANVAAARKGDNEPLTVQRLFESEFPNTLRVAAILRLTKESDSDEVSLLGKVCMDFAAGSKFSAFLAPTGESTVALAEHIATTHEELVGLIERSSSVSGGAIGQPEVTDSKHLRHSGRVVLYHEDHLTAGQIAKLEESFKANGLSLLLRGPDYLAYQELARQQR